MPEVTKADQIAASGVTRVQLLVEEELCWIFRRIDQRDTGLDAEVEVVLADQATGLLIGLQIKTGASYFSEPTATGWKYRGDYDHLRYWRNHNLSVLVVLVDEATKTAYWASVEPDAQIHQAEKSWTLEVLRDQEVSSSCRNPWMDLAWARDPRAALFKYCSVQNKYVDLLASGGRIFIEVDEWVNKMRGQADFRLLLRDEEADTTEEQHLSIFAGVPKIHDFVTRVFPWADVTIDEEYYELNEDVPPDAVFQDSESDGGYVIFEGDRPTGIRHYAEKENGEIACYRFELTLNDVGKAYSTLCLHAERLEKHPPYYLATAFEKIAKS